jgi:hypothetical protein
MDWSRSGREPAYIPDLLPEHDQPCGLPVLALAGMPRREFLDRGSLIWNHAHPRRILRDYEISTSRTRSLHIAAALKRLTQSADRPVPHPKTRSRRWPDQRT